MKSIKIVLLGQCGVGKSTLAHQMIYGQLLQCNATIGAAYLACNIGDCKLDIWDTAGAEKYRAVMPMYTRNAGIVIAVYDVTNYDSVQRLVEDRNTFSIPSTARWIVVGNKMDTTATTASSAPNTLVLKRAQALADDWKALHIQTSATTGENVAKVFEHIIQIVRSTTTFGDNNMVSPQSDILSTSGMVRITQPDRPHNDSSSPIVNILTRC